MGRYRRFFTAKIAESAEKSSERGDRSSRRNGLITLLAAGLLVGAVRA
jgi:hypothetical protein